MDSKERLNTLNDMKAKVKANLERKKRDPFYTGKRMEGYEEAMLAVLSMIHREKEKLK